MGTGAVPPAPFQPSPDFLAWLEQLANQPRPPMRPVPVPLPDPDDDD
jgi:hypothetical protein